MRWIWLPLGMGSVAPFLLVMHLTGWHRLLIYCLLASLVLTLAFAVSGKTARRSVAFLVFSGALLQGEWRAQHTFEVAGLSQRFEVVLEGRVCDRVVASFNASVAVPFCVTRSFDSSAIDLLGRRVALTCYDCEAAAPEEGKYYRIQARLKPARPATVNSDIWAWHRQLRLESGVRGTLSEWKAVPGEGFLSGQMLRWRLRIQDRYSALTRMIPGGGLLDAMVLGRKESLETSDWEILRESGLVHLAVVSGLHLGLLTALVYALATALQRLSPRLGNDHAAALCAGLFILVYLLLVGFAVPVFRAAVMAWLGLLLWVFRRRLSFWQVYCLAVSLVLLVEPLSVFGPGFWLSFLSVAVIALALPTRKSQTERTWSSRLKTVIRLQILLTMGSMPVLALTQSEVPLASPLLNLVAVPLVSLLILPAGFLLLLVQPVSDALAETLATCLEPLLTLFWQIAQSSAYLPVMEFPSFSYASVISLLILFLMALWFQSRQVLLWWGVLVVGSAGWPEPGLHGNEARLVVHNVGQGLAMTLEHGGQVMIYDTGMAWPGYPSRARQVLIPWLHQQGYREIEELVVSHADDDHAGGAEDILAAFPVRRLWLGEPLKKFLRPGEPCETGKRIYLGSVRVQQLWPPPDEIWAGNDVSCTFMLQYAGRSILIPGDLEKAAQTELVNRFGGKLKADILIIPHHGAKSSFLPAFLHAVAPAQTIVSAGFLNRFGHPHDEVVAWLARRGVQQWDTARHGSVRVSWGPGQPLRTAPDD